MRQRNKPWAKDKLQQNPAVVIANPSNYRGRWTEIFGNNNPIHIEVGTGKGRFICEMAKKNPQINFIGIEQSTSVIVSALDKVLEEALPNVRILNENGLDLQQFFQTGEVHIVYLNFSDPWPKTRHEKRRLTHASFLDQYKAIMIKNGEVHFKTDNQSLFEYSLHSFSKYGMILNNVSLDLHNSGMENNVMTEYEEKFSEKGNRIYRCEALFRE